MSLIIFLSHTRFCRGHALAGGGYQVKAPAEATRPQTGQLKLKRESYASLPFWHCWQIEPGRGAHTFFSPASLRHQYCFPVVGPFP